MRSNRFANLLVLEAETGSGKTEAALWRFKTDGEGSPRERWAAEHPKRFLAATIAVGTIDQALLGTIAVKHAHMRETALMSHLLVVDEVHASDAYMERLLR